MSGRKRQKTGMIDNENENNSMAQEIQQHDTADS